MNPKTLILLACLLAFAGPLKAQHRTTVVPDINFDQNISLSNYTIKNAAGQKVGWETPSLFLPELTGNINVYNATFPIDFSLTLPVRKNFANNYNNLARKDTITINRYYQFSPGLNIKIKLGNFRLSDNWYWVIYAGANYDMNFLGKRKEMTYDYKSFDPLNSEFNLIHGIANQWERGIFGKTFNTTSDMTINMKGGPTASFGLGREWSIEGRGTTCILAVTRKFYSIYDPNYQLANGTKPFAGWHQSPYMLEFKVFFKFPLSSLPAELLGIHDDD